MIGVLVVERAEDGSLTIIAAPDEIHVADEFLASCEKWGVPEVTYGDGIFTVRAKNGTVSYGLCDYDLLCCWWRGVKSGAT